MGACRRRPSVGAIEFVRHSLVIGRSLVANRDRKGDARMSAQTQYLEVDAVGVFPALLLLLVVLLTTLGIVAHVAFG